MVPVGLGVGSGDIWLGFLRSCLQDPQELVSSHPTNSPVGLRILMLKMRTELRI
jgi:hypothetical protein